ncbi:MAG: helix-turn-helix transcriptional regulator [Lachnospiraceae bacterium]|nr:helix-turn-helix transcriptional regulator [Lachnospiraceae bacterium]
MAATVINDTDTYSLTDEEKLRLGRSLKEIREEKHLSQDDLARLLNCTPQYISDVERGRYGLSLKKLMLFCKECEISCDTLIYGRPGVYPENDERRRIMDLLDRLNEDQLSAVREFLKAVLKLSRHP